MQENLVGLDAVFAVLPGNNALLLADAPKFTIVALSDEYIQTVGRAKEEMVGKGLFEAFPTPPGEGLQSENSLRASLEQVLKHKQVHHLPLQRYDIPTNDGQFVERYWKAINKPVLNEQKDVVYILHHVNDETEQIQVEKREAQIKGIEKAYGLFMQAPVVISIIKGEEQVLELANPEALKLWGKTGEVVGKPLSEIIPEIKEQGILELLKQVRQTGQPYIAKEEPMFSVVNGKKEVHYFDRVYQPYYNEGEKVASGVFTLSHDVTELVVARQQVQESEQKYRSLFNSMDQGFCLMEMIFDTDNNPIDYRFLETNAVFEKQTGLHEAVGKTARQLVPNLESHWFELYGKVALTGESTRFIEGSAAMDRWFEVYAFKPGGSESRNVALLFSDISERKKAEEAIRQSESNLRNTILQAPVAMGIFRGPSFVVEIANDAMFELWGRSKETLLNKSIFEGLPEVKDQGYEELLTSVYTTGERFSAQGIPVTLPRNGSTETVYINLLYEAFREADGTISGVIAVATDVTDQVIARKKVEEVNQEFQFVTDTMPQLVWASEANGASYFFNKRWLEYTGLTLEEVKGDGWMQSLHPDDLQRTKDAWTQAFKHGASYEIEYRLRRYDGIYRWFLTRGTPMKNEEGKIVKWYGATTDIDEQKKSAEALLQITERYDLVSKATQDAIWDWNLLTDEVVWNEGVQKLFGYRMDEVIRHADWWYDHVHPDDRDQAVATLHEVFDKGGSSCIREYRFLCADGSYKIVFDRGFIQQDETGKPVRMLGSMQDITERKQIIESLRESEERFRFMVNTVPQNIWITDAMGNVEFLNQHWCDYCGVPYSATTSDDISHKHLHPEDGAKVRQVFGAAMQTGEPWEVEQRNLSKNGEYRWFLNRATPYKDPTTGKVLKWFGVGVDIHDRKLEEQALQRSEEELEKKVKERTLELEKANQELKRSNKNLEEFAYAASHDLKEPTRKIHVFSERLKDSIGERLTETEKQYFQRMELASKRMSTLIDDLLTYSEVSQKAILDQDVDLNFIIDCVLSDLDLEIEQKGATIKVSKLFFIKGQRRQLQQAFQNLISNALKYSNPEVAPIISIECATVKGAETALRLTGEEEAKAFYQVTVKDNGIGFEQADAERIFNVFTRLHGMTEYKGTGVGLSIVRKVIENHKGYIWAESQPGEGARFKILLPVD